MIETDRHSCSYPLVSKSYKGLFPFRIGTTSYIYPDHIIPNVKILGPYLDEIELLLLESSPDSLPSKNEINHLKVLAKQFGIYYNIHLPTDIFLGDADPSIRQQAVDTIKRIIDLTATLPVTTCTLHLEYNLKAYKKNHVNNWQTLVCQSLNRLLASGIDSKTISIETLMYPFEWLETIISDYKFSICIDIGHLMLQDIDLETFFNKYGHQTSIIHLHGLKNNHDHVSLASLGNNKIKSIVKILKQFTKSVSLEVFAYNDLETSLKFLEKHFFA